MKIEVKIDLDEFIERWGEQTFEDCIKEEIRFEVIRNVKNTDAYKEIVRKQQESMMKKLLDHL